MRFSWNSFRVIMKIGLPAGIQSAVFSISNIVIQSAINSLGTVVIAASSAAFNIEVIAYDVMNSFSQACTTFVGQNYGAGQIKRCKRTLWLTLIEDTIASGVAIGIVLLVGRFLLSVFNSDPQVIEIGYTRLVIVFSAYTFSMLYEIMSGYLRGFGVSLVPAVLTMIGVCGIRIAWIELVFPKNHNFETIMTVYPISLAATARTHVTCTLYICWGAQAGLYHFYGVPKYQLDKKMFGIFPQKPLDPSQPIFRGFDDIFYMPHSRHTEVRREDIEKVPGLDIIAESPESGVSIVMARGGREFFVTGHMEYAPNTLDKEYKRDMGKRDDVELPKNYYYNDDPNEAPLVTWRAHANLFYSNWINYYVYQETPYNIDDIK